MNEQNQTEPGELQKLKAMSFSQKLEYLWMYYKLPALVCVFVGLFLVGTAYAAISLFSHSDKGIELVFIDISCSDPASAQQCIEDLIGAAKETEIDNNAEPVSLDFSYSLSKDLDEYTRSLMLLKLNSAINAGEISLFVSDTDVIDYLGSLEHLADLKEILPSQLYEFFEEHNMLIACTVEADEVYQTDAYSYVCGIDLSNLDLAAFDRTGFLFGETIAIGFPAKIKSVNTAVGLLEQLIFQYF